MRTAWFLSWALAFVVAQTTAYASTCRIENVTPITFGGYTSGSTASLDSVGELDVSCADMTSVRIVLGRGTSGRLSPREMRGPSASLSYGLFFDAARTAAWGDGSEGTSAFLGVLPAGQVARLPVFGRIFSDCRASRPVGTSTR